MSGASAKAPAASSRWRHWPFSRLLAVGQGGAGGDQHLRRVALQFLQHGGGLEAEHAGVPQVLAAVQVGLGGGLVGFLDEACDPEAVAQRGALFGSVAKIGGSQR